MQYTFKTREKDRGLKLSKFLKNQGVSIALIKKIKFNRDGITVDGVKQNTDYRLQPWQNVTVNLDGTREETDVVPRYGHLNILYLDNCCMVVEKPRNMPCHPSFNHYDDTLANYFVGYWLERGETKVPRIVNRLDRNTSGLVLIALDAYTAEFLKDKAEKTYTAIVSGSLEKDHGIIDAPIARADNSLMIRCVREDGQNAVTEYFTEKSGNGMSLVNIKLHTGRTHQIRVHFSYIGHSLLGDDLYGGETDKIGRHALHCSHLSFTTPDGGKRVELASKLPADMENLVNQM